jgi:hypothetical protein
LKGYSYPQILVYIRAYDFFCFNPFQYDGATLVKDLMDIPGLDLDAMLHDYNYIKYNAGVNLGIKLRADWLIAKEGERKGKGIYSSYSKFIGLTISTVVFTPYSFFKRGSTTDLQKKEFLNDYETLMVR